MPYLGGDFMTLQRFDLFALVWKYLIIQIMLC